MPAVPFLVKLERGKRYEITMSSKTIDSFLVVHDSRGKQIAIDDDSGGGLDAALELEAPESATYRIHAASFKGEGEFTLRVQVVDGARNELAVGEEGLTIAGRLAGNEPKVKVIVPGGQGELPAKQYLVKLEAGTQYEITMSSKTLGQAFWPCRIPRASSSPSTTTAAADSMPHSGSPHPNPLRIGSMRPH